MTDSKQRRYDRETPLMTDKVAERELRYDTGDEHRAINEPSASTVAWTVDDEIAKAAALDNAEQGREQRKQEHERRTEAAREAQSRDNERNGDNRRSDKREARTDSRASTAKKD